MGLLQESSQFRGNRVLLGKGEGGGQVSCFLLLATALAPYPSMGLPGKSGLEFQAEWVCQPRDRGHFQAGRSEWINKLLGQGSRG